MKRIVKYDCTLVREKSFPYETKSATSSSMVSGFLYSALDVASWDREKFGFISLDTRMNIIGLHIISEGTTNQAVVHVKEVAKRALNNNAVSVILFHNHPSDTATFSQTARIKTGLQVVDHVLLHNQVRYTSMAESGLL